MMNALSLAVYLERENDVAAALQTWEREERALTDYVAAVLLVGPGFLLLFWLHGRQMLESDAPSERSAESA